ncbi:MAG: sterol desaturase [Myxococcota bacterium]
MFSELNASTVVGLAGGVALVVGILYEWLAGKYKDGKKTREDWLMGGLSASFLSIVQRPLLLVVVFAAMTGLFPAHEASLNFIDTQYFWWGLLGFILIDEFLHGATHKLAHIPKVKNKVVRRVQEFYRKAHRPHHLVGGNDGKGELSVTHTIVEGWAWWLFLPNYAFGFAALYLGLHDIFIWGTLIKGVWGLHVHTNWNYDLYFLNHSNKYVRKAMYALCHVITFPTMHQHHHSRGKNSAKNMQNLLALYDWLFWGIAIETERPKTFGWRQKAAEEHDVIHRFFHTKPKPAPVAEAA